MGKHFNSYAELKEKQIEGIDYRRIVRRWESPIAILAPHGGGIEPGTSEIVCALAGDRFSYYCFEGLKEVNSRHLHITSTRFDEPIALDLVRSVQTVVTVHGCSGWDGLAHIGGRDSILKTWVIGALQDAGFDAIDDDDSEHSGKDPRNICNLGRSGKGLQLELDEGLRRLMFKGYRRAEREHTTRQFERFNLAVQGVLHDYCIRYLPSS